LFRKEFYFFNISYIGFTSLEDSMELAEKFIKFSLEYILKNNMTDLIYINNNYSKSLIDNIRKFISQQFYKIPYTEAIDILLKACKNKKNIFKENVVWGINFSSEHEKYLTDIYFKATVVVYDFPKRLKKFYMKENKDGETVSSFDVLIPQIGEIVGGSEREINEIILRESLNREFKENEEEKLKYEWYIQMREFGSPPHSGFGLGFDRLVMLATGISDIKDVIPYPRYPKHSEF